MIRQRVLPLTGLPTLALALTMAACGAAADAALETRTFPIEYLDPAIARSLIEPYILSEGAMIQDAVPGTPAISVRERREILDRIAATLDEYDRPTARSVALRFQIIEADGFEATDPEIAEIESVLRELFRFEGYRLVGEAWVLGRGLSEFRQQVDDTGGGTNDLFHLNGSIRDIQVNPDGVGRVSLNVELWHGDHDPFFVAEISVPIGQTVVIGGGKPAARERTLILAVRPEVAP